MHERDNEMQSDRVKCYKRTEVARSMYASKSLCLGDQHTN